MRVDWCVSSWFRIKNTHTQPAVAVAAATAPCERELVFKFFFCTTLTLGTGLARTGMARRDFKFFFWKAPGSTCVFLLVAILPQPSYRRLDIAAAPTGGELRPDARRSAC